MRGCGIALFAACITGTHMAAVRSLHNRDDYIRQTANTLQEYQHLYTAPLETTPDQFGLVFENNIWKCPPNKMLKFRSQVRLGDYPSQRDQCLDFDWEGMGDDVTVETECGKTRKGTDIFHFTALINQIKGDEYHDYCQEDLTNNNGYCNKYSETKFRCGTGACCRNKLDTDRSIDGCNCLNDPGIFSHNSDWPRQIRHAYCSDSGVRTNAARFHCVPSLKFLLCACVDGPNTGYYIDGNSIQTQLTQCGKGEYNEGKSETSGGSCKSCSPGKFKNEEDTLNYHPDCQECAIGKFSGAPGAAFCTSCPNGKYQSDMGKSSCDDCQQCNEDDKHEVSPCNWDGWNDWNQGHARINHECVCSVGYERVGSVCDPVGKNWYKDKIGDRTAERCPITSDGTQKVTLNVGSTSQENCVCPENMYYDKTNDWCIQCEWHRPWRKLEWLDSADACKACESWQYWSDSSEECLEIERMRIVRVPGESFNIEGVDKSRRQSPRHMKNVERLSSTQYLLVNEDDPSLNNTVKECSPQCGHFAKREGCGNEAMPKWIAFEYSGNTFERMAPSLPVTTGEDLDFWSNNIQNPRIVREGRCTRCVNCAIGQYQSGCTETNTCLSCEPVACQSSEYKFHPINATFQGGTWTGACHQTPNVAVVPYTCTPCRRWENEGGRYMLMLGCGSEATYTRWHPENVGDNQLESLTCTYDDTNNPQCKLPNQDKFASTSELVRFTHKIPYCKPGWYVDVSDELCPLSQDDGGSAWSAACCKICGSENEGQEIRAHDYKTCTGTSTEDTQRYTDRCENNYHQTWNGNAEECALCTSCES